MVSDYFEILSDSAKGMKRSAIRELLKITEDPAIISFGGGLPAKDAFPLEQLRELCNEVLEKEGPVACQYGSTEGITKLRQILVDRYHKEGMDYVKMENITMLTSSQQGLDFMARIFCNRGDSIICEVPTYMAALGAFRAAGIRCIGIRQDGDGMRSDLLEKKLAEMKANGEKPKFIYIIPDFQNPAGMTMSEARRSEVLDIAKRYEVLIIEDSPYRELRYQGKPQRMIYDLDKGEGNVIAFTTFSKTFVPGFRLAWVLAHPYVIDNVIKTKQIADLCCSPMLQLITYQYLAKGWYDINLEKIKNLYHRKLDSIIANFEKYMPEGVTWTHPEGGLFLFLSMPEGYDANELFKIAIEKKVAFVPGGDFHCDGSGKNTMRINYSYESEETNEEGVRRLADAIRELMSR